MIALLPKEQQWHIQQGYSVQNGFLYPNESETLCPHLAHETGLCAVHFTAHKPFSCIKSPFTLNKSNTLVMRRRNTCFKCFGIGQPAYRVFYASLLLMFNEAEAERICKMAETSTDDFYAEMDEQVWEKIQYLVRLRAQEKQRRISEHID